MPQMKWAIPNCQLQLKELILHLAKQGDKKSAPLLMLMKP